MNRLNKEMKVLILTGVMLGWLISGCEWDSGRTDGGSGRLGPPVASPGLEAHESLAKQAVEEALPELVPAVAPEPLGGPPDPMVGQNGLDVPVVEFAFPHADRASVDHLTEAAEKLGQKDTIGALLELQKALYDDPQHFAAAMMLGRTALKADRKELAVDAFVLASQIEPDLDDPWLQLARVSLQSDDLDQAEQLVRTALRLNPKRALSRNVLGRIWLGRSHWQRAILQFQQACELDPENKYYRNNLGFAYLLKKDFVKAVEVLEPLGRRKDVPAYMFNNLGLAYEGAGRLQESIALFKLALEGRPGYVNARVNLDRLIQVAQRSGSKPGEDLEKGGGPELEEVADEEPVEEEQLLIPESEDL